MNEGGLRRYGQHGPLLVTRVTLTIRVAWRHVLGLLSIFAGGGLVPCWVWTYLVSRSSGKVGAALRVPSGARLLDLACGSGELPCTWARDHGLTDAGWI